MLTINSLLSALCVLLLATAAAPSSAANEQGCFAKSSARVPTLVELYTSEGCDSCPPADRWLSKFVAGSPDNVVALAFHVDYWDYIGWKDEFAKPAYGARQASLVKTSGASGTYTPQIFVNGRDDRSWTAGQGPRATGAAATVALSVQATWQGDELMLSGLIAGPTGADAAARASVARLRYAYTENGLGTAVKAGENRGVTLNHDAVVRDHGAVVAKNDGSFALSAKAPRAAKRGQSMLHVIAENASGQALASVSMRCE